MRIHLVKFLSSIVMMFSSVCIFGQQEIKKKNDSLPVIKIVGVTKIYSADKSFNDQLKTSSFFLNNNDVTFKKTRGKVDSLFVRSIENRNLRVDKKRTNVK